MALLRRQGSNPITGLLVLVTALLLGLGAPVAFGAETRDEYAVKAAFLLNFVRLSEWPDVSAPSGQEPFLICVVGSRSAYDAIAAGSRDVKVHTRSVRVRLAQGVGDSDGCQVQFVSHDVGVPDRPRLQALHRRGVLSVGESEGFADGGGVINFFALQKKVRFEINREAAGQSMYS